MKLYQVTAKDSPDRIFVSEEDAIDHANKASEACYKDQTIAQWDGKTLNCDGSIKWVQTGKVLGADWEAMILGLEGDDD